MCSTFVWRNAIFLFIFISNIFFHIDRRDCERVKQRQYRGPKIRFVVVAIDQRVCAANKSRGKQIGRADS